MNDFKIHECERQTNNVFIEYSDAFFGDEMSWNMTIMCLATEDDLAENHYLDEVGEIIWSTAVTINNCPFCAAKLVDYPISEVRMMHLDSRLNTKKIRAR